MESPPRATRPARLASQRVMRPHHLREEGSTMSVQVPTVTLINGGEVQILGA